MRSRVESRPFHARSPLDAESSSSPFSSPISAGARRLAEAHPGRSSRSLQHAGFRAFPLSARQSRMSAHPKSSRAIRATSCAPGWNHDPFMREALLMREVRPLRFLLRSLQGLGGWRRYILAAAAGASSTLAFAPFRCLQGRAGCLRIRSRRGQSVPHHALQGGITALSCEKPS